MIVGPPSQRPTVLALRFRDPLIVDAGPAPPHQPFLVELPILIAMRAVPVAAIVMPLIDEANGDAVAGERPKLLDQPVIQFALPFAREKSLDRLAALRELGAVAPVAVDRIALSNALRIAGVPGILGQPCLQSGRLGGEGR